MRDVVVEITVVLADGDKFSKSSADIFNGGASTETPFVYRFGICFLHDSD